MNSHIRIFRVSAVVVQGEFDIDVSLWNLLIETNRYYEIKPESGAVKRIYKEKLNTVIDETKFYTNGSLSYTAFCIEDRIADMRMEIVQKLQLKINTYISQLQLNQRAIEQQYLLLHTKHHVETGLH
ncbi:hypothetical protein ACP8HI_26425 [Paenibacillus sp. FA6]|uniref:hypothetical protein n=1 Tax=Paenibacillus sp. FA6 TaxID=3413029 RepID=UPI003F660A06